MYFSNYHTAQQQECISVKNPHAITEWIKKNKPYLLKKKTEHVLNPQDTEKLSPTRPKQGTEEQRVLTRLTQGSMTTRTMTQLQRQRTKSKIAMLRKKGWNIDTRKSQDDNGFMITTWTLINE